MDVTPVRKTYYFLTCCISATFGSVVGDLLIRCSLGLHNLIIGIFVGLICGAITLWIIERRYTDAPQ